MYIYIYIYVYIHVYIHIYTYMIIDKICSEIDGAFGTEQVKDRPLRVFCDQRELVAQKYLAHKRQRPSWTLQ
jgi:predicted membrane chloride channel (bestrophin family)